MEQGQRRGVEAYPPVGGADIFSENSPLVSASGFMISLLSRFHHNFSLLLYSISVWLSVMACKICPRRVKTELNRLVLHRWYFLKCTQYVTIVKICVDILDVLHRGLLRWCWTGCRAVLWLQWLNVQTLRLINVSPELLQFCQSLIPGGILSFAC